MLPAQEISVPIFLIFTDFLMLKDSMIIPLKNNIKIKIKVELSPTLHRCTGELPSFYGLAPHPQHSWKYVLHPAILILTGLVVYPFCSSWQKLHLRFLPLLLQLQRSP